MLGFPEAGVPTEAESPQDTPVFGVWISPGTMASLESARDPAMAPPMHMDGLSPWTSYLPKDFPKGLHCLWARGNGKLSPFFFA